MPATMLPPIGCSSPLASPPVSCRCRDARQGRRQARQAADGEHRQFEQDRRPEQQHDRRDIARQRRGQRRADDRAERRPGGDEAEQPLALLGAEQIDVHLPEDRDDEQIVDRDPDEEGPADPHRLRRIGDVKQRREQDDVEGEKPVGQRNEAPARQGLDEIGEGQVQHHHADERAGEQPLQIVDPAGDPIWSRIGRMM